MPARHDRLERPARLVAHSPALRLDSTSSDRAPRVDLTLGVVRILDSHSTSHNQASSGDSQAGEWLLVDGPNEGKVLGCDLVFPRTTIRCCRLTLKRRVALLESHPLPLN
jgi:hypothetical protein